MNRHIELIAAQLAVVCESRIRRLLVNLSLPWPAGPETQAVEIEVDDRCGVEGRQLADDQPADDRNPEWAAQFGLPRTACRAASLVSDP